MGYGSHTLIPSSPDEVTVLPLHGLAMPHVGQPSYAHDTPYEVPQDVFPLTQSSSNVSISSVIYILLFQFDILHKFRKLGF